MIGIPSTSQGEQHPVKRRNFQNLFGYWLVAWREPYTDSPYKCVLELIRDVNRTLLKDIEERVNKWDDAQAIGDVFLTLVC